MMPLRALTLDRGGDLGERMGGGGGKVAVGELSGVQAELQEEES